MKQIIPIRPFKTAYFSVEIQTKASTSPAQAAPRRMARLKAACFTLGIVPMVISCASTPLALAPVGPGPAPYPGSVQGLGDLQVYSEHEEYYEDQSSYFPHTDYQIYTPDGRRLQRVWNHHTHQDEAPALVSLQPGEYVVVAWAEFYGLVKVPVVIKPNQLTKVILQPGWAPGNLVRSELVQMPGGYYVGWRANLAAN